MLKNFPLVHKDELLYSLIIRYQCLSGNRNFKETLLELFGRPTIQPVVDLPCHLEALAQNIPDEMGLSSNTLVQKHTLFPLYSPFMTVTKRNELLKIMKHENGNLLKYKIGIIAGSVCQKNALFYCPECAREELEQYREVFLHRTHQVQGVYVCEKHTCILHVFPIHSNRTVELVTINESKLDLRNLNLKDHELQRKLAIIAKETYLLLNDDCLAGLNIDIIHELYMKELKARGYLTMKGNIRQQDIFDDFTNYHGTALLAFLESELDESNQYNWLKLITRQKRRAIHPIRHLLFIGFLFGGIRGLLLAHQGKGNLAPEKPLGLCLNPVCECFQKPVVTDIKTTADYKTREPVLTLTCQCGFSYSRKEKDDALKIGTIKTFGHIWENKLIDAIHSNSSLRAMAKQMGCDCKTVVKYAERLGIRHLIHSGMSFKGNEIKSDVPKIDSEQYKNDILNLVKSNPVITRQEVRDTLKKQCTWLYRHDREWYEKHLPKAQENKGYVKPMTEHWEKIDDEILMLLEKEYAKLMAYEKPIRITKSLLGKRVGKLVYLEHNLDNLPKTKEYLGSILETVEAFQRRRVALICERLTEKGEPLVGWKIAKMAGMKDTMAVFQIINTM